MKRNGLITGVTAKLDGQPPHKPQPTRPRARGVTKPGTMNKTEAAYARHLELLRAAGEIVWWKYEAVKLRLADRTFYTPDFCVMLSSGEIQFFETKGHWEDDARVKIKVAAEQFPFFFVAVKKAGNGWETETL